MENKKEKMTAEEAIEFSGYSQVNAAIVQSSLPCGCEPYQDVFTFNRWKAQGYHVRREEHGIKLAVIKSIERESKETGEVETRRIFGSSHVFCRCQVDQDGDKWPCRQPAAMVGEVCNSSLCKP